MRGLFSPHKIVDAVEAALSQPFDEGMRTERELFLQCIDSPQRAGLIHAFFAEREVLKAPETRAAQPRAIASAGIIGGGTMGAGIAVAMLDAGLPVTMIERDADSLARGRANVEKVYDGLIAKGRMNAEAKAAVMARFSGSTDYDALRDADLVVEAVFEDMAVKKAVFAELDRVCKRGAVLATNTSYLDIDEIAASISRPGDVLGLHFFSPANIMKLLEIVVPAQVSADVVATGFELAKKLKQGAGARRRVRRLHRQPHPRGLPPGRRLHDGRRRLALPDRPGGARLRLPDGPVPGVRPGRRRHRLGHAQAPRRHARPAARATCRSPTASASAAGSARRPAAATTCTREGARTGTPDPEVAAIIDAERQRAASRRAPSPTRKSCAATWPR